MKKLRIGLFFLIKSWCFFANDQADSLRQSLIDDLAQNSLLQYYQDINNELINIDQIVDTRQRLLRKLNLADTCIDVIKKTYTKSPADQQFVKNLLKAQKKYHAQLKWRSCGQCCVTYFAHPIANEYVDMVSKIAYTRLEILQK